MSTGEFESWYQGAPVFTGLANSGDFASWYRGAPVLDLGAPVSVALDRHGRIPVEVGQVVLRHGFIPVDSLGTLLRTGQIPVETLGALVRDGHLPLEYLGILVRTGQLPLEFIGVLLRTGIIPVETLGALVRDGHIPLEQLGMLVRAGQLPVEFLGMLVRSGLVPLEFTGLAAFTLSRSALLPVDSLQGVAPFIFANWLAAGGGAPVWWPTTLYSYYPQQPLFTPGDKPAKHLRTRRRARARDRAARSTEAFRHDEDYDAIVRALYRSFMVPRPRMLVAPVHPTVVETVTRTRLPAIVPVSTTFVQALREDAELLEFGLL